MAKLCLKKTSKRVSCRTRYKVEHKVREHNRKKRRAAKKDPFHKGRSAHKKLIHVPNICPFKEDILKEVADVKKRKEEDRLKQREEWKKEREAAKEGASSLAALAADAESRQAVHEHLTPAVTEPDATEREYKLDGSLKAYYREFKKVIEEADVVLEVVDARDPLGTRCLAVEQAVLDSPGNKRLIIVLNKSDLVPRDNLDAWLKYLRRSFPTTAMKASTQGQKNHLAHRKFKPNVAVKGSNCVGASLLMSLLANYCRNKGLKTAITVGVVGMPNVGKSSLVNSLKRSRACQVGGLPGVTKQMQVVQLDSKIKLIDSPGVVMTRSPCDASSALRNTVDVNRMRDPMPPALAILARASRAHLTDMYDLKDYATPVEFLAALARRYGKNKRGGVPDVEVAARMLVGDWNRGKIRYHTIPPEESLDSHVSAEIVQQMAAEFNIDEVAALEAEVLESLGADQAAGASFAVPTAAPMEVVGAQGGAGSAEVLGGNVALAPAESKKKLRWRKEAAAATDGADKPDKEAKIAGNQKLNKVKKVQFKKLKKEQARSERKTDSLADVLDNFSFEAAAPADEAEAGGPDDAYDFDTDFAM